LGFGQVVVAKSLNTTSKTEAERLEKQHDVEFERRLCEARDASDPQAAAMHIADRVRIEVGSPNSYRYATEELAENTVLTDEQREIAEAIIGERLDQRFTMVGNVNRLLSDLRNVLPSTPLDPEVWQRCRDGIVAVVQQHVATATDGPAPSVVNGMHTLEWGYSRWLRAGEGDRAPGTVKLARRHWDAFVAHSKLVMLADVRRSHVLGWRDHLVDQREHRPKSINQRLQLVTAILRAGWRDAEMPQPDLKGITLPEPDDSGRGAWSRAEILKVLNALQPHSWQAWVYLIGLTTATRLGEPIAAQRSWWNPKTGFIELRDRRLAKADKEHAMPIIECLREPFAAYVAKRPDGFLFDAPRPKDPDIPISNLASKTLNRFFKRQGISRVFHELRDSWIEEARHSSVKKELWEIISGHSAATVSDRYGGEKPEVLAKANEEVCRFLTQDAEIMAAITRLLYSK
jgi:integrase